MNAIAKTPANDDAITEPQAPGTLIEFLARAVRDPSIDVHKLEAIYRIIADERREQRALAAETRRIQFDVAMNAVQAEMRPVARNAVNSEKGNKYATLEAVDDAIRPIYTKRGFHLSFTETPDDAPEMRISCIVSRAGHRETFSLPAMSDIAGPKGTPNKTSVQGVGSAVTYLRRYLKMMIFDLAFTDDNDGNRIKPNAATETGELITRPQIAELRALMLETRIMESVVLAKKAPGLATIEALPSAAFATICSRAGTCWRSARRILRPKQE